MFRQIRRVLISQEQSKPETHTLHCHISSADTCTNLAMNLCCSKGLKVRFRKVIRCQIMFLISFFIRNKINTYVTQWNYFYVEITSKEDGGVEIIAKEDGGNHDLLGTQWNWMLIHAVALLTKPVYILNSQHIWFLDDMKQMSPGISRPQAEEWEHVYTVPLGLGFTVGRKKILLKKQNKTKTVFRTEPDCPAQFSVTRQMTPYGKWQSRLTFFLWTLLQPLNHYHTSFLFL